MLELVQERLLRTIRTSGRGFSARECFRRIEEGENCLGTIGYLRMKWALKKLGVAGPGALDDSDHAVRGLLWTIGRVNDPRYPT